MAGKHGTKVHWVFKWHRPPRDATAHSFSMGRVVSTTVNGFTDGMSSVRGWLLATTNGQGLTLVLCSVVLVQSNQVPSMALMQLGIWNKTQTTFPLKTIIKGVLTSPRQDELVNWVWGYWVTGESQSGGTPDQQNLIPESPRLGVYIVFVGVGLLLETVCMCVSHKLLSHMDQHWKPNWQWVMISTIPVLPPAALMGHVVQTGQESLSISFSVTYKCLKESNGLMD